MPKNVAKMATFGDRLSGRPAAERGRFAYSALDRVIHENARLGLMAALAAHRAGLVFSDLKRLCALTDGNLSRHLQVLEQAGLVAIDKSFVGKRPATTVRMTRRGRQRFVDYIAELERVVRDAAPFAEPKAADVEAKVRARD